MITQMRLQNYKPWRDTGLMNLAPLTAVFGPNSSGKTSLLQMLLLIRQTVDSPDRNQVLNLGGETSLVQLGTLQEILFNHDLTSTLHCELDWKLPMELRIEDPFKENRVLFAGDSLAFSVDVSWKDPGASLEGRVEQLKHAFDPWGLSEAERKVALLTIEGKTNKSIARILRRSSETPKRQLQSIFAKVGVRNRTELANKIPIAAIEPLGGRAVVERMAYRFAGREFGMRLASAKGNLSYEFVEPAVGFRFIRGHRAQSRLPRPVKFYGFPDQVRGLYKNAGFLSDFELSFEETFSQVFYLGPLREYPRPEYPWAGDRPSDMGRRGEKVVDALLASREAGPNIPFHTGGATRRYNLEQRVAQWLKDLGLIHSFDVRAIAGSKFFQVWVRRNPKATEVLITDVGFGVSQILPVITLCYYAPKGSTVLLEQPEIHLHPSVQADLADVFIDAVQTRGIQIILESHSEHLLRRLQRRVAEEILKREDAALYFCSAPDREALLTPLELDPFGNITNWPEDFFGDELGEIAEMSKAIVARKKRGYR